ncbi:MAG: LacI family DNA-binding transcriptional regulator [Coraliomargaritaceae bacterium]
MIKLIDIANHLKLSRVTVSAVLNNRHNALGISQSTADRVLKTAKEMGYQRNEMAMSIKTRKSFLVGCMTGALNFGWGGRILQGALLGLQEKPYSLKVESVENGLECDAAVQRFIGARVAGIFACNINPSMDDSAKLKSQLNRYKIPLICNNCRSDLSPLQVEADHKAGSLLAVEYLAQLGHKKIAYISGDTSSNTSISRKEGFIEALGKCGLSLGPNHLEKGLWDFDETTNAVKRLLKERQKPTAILCANDEMAVVAMRTIQEAGLRVPEDISVIGFSNTRLSELSNPQLTTIAQPEFEIGKQSIEHLIELFDLDDDTPITPKTYLLPSELVIRESTGRCLLT